VKFVSVNGRSAPVDFETALFTGLADDGGLYAPERVPPLSRPDAASGTLHDTGVEALSPFLEDLPAEVLRGVIETAWDFPLPLRTLDDDIHVLELFHGPTLAFKDVGARFMARLMGHYLERAARRVTLVVATSGDTGSAVAHGFHNVPGVDVFVLYPSGRVSPLQEQQMTTLGGNIHAIEVRGAFDDCQAMVKRALNDPELTGLTTANSINIGRLLPQVVFYVFGWREWRRLDGNPGGSPRFVVPSGNFGNLTAALYAQAMGVPMGRCVAATNANDVFPEYLGSGAYHPRSSVRTLSTAMDVGAPSNLARIQALLGNDAAHIRERVEAVAVDDTATLTEIRQTHQRTGVVLDPHTAVGVAAARRVRTAGETAPLLVAATAHPGKFPEVVEQALGVAPPMPAALREAMGRAKLSRVMDPDYAAWRRVLLGD